MSFSEDSLLSVARAAADAAAAELVPRFGHALHDIRTKSGPTDPVSEADVAAETAIRRLLESERPNDAILGEEGGATGEGELRWVIDPLDGTVNYLFGIPQFAVSVACEDGDGALVGVVLDPIRDECFSATRSGPALLNGDQIMGSDRSGLSTALVATGFAYDAEVRARQATIAAQLLPHVRDIRRAGAAALDLAWCACGRYDAYFERGLHAWDHAAGGLVAARAGLAVRTLPAVDGLPDGVAVAPPALIDELLGFVGHA